MLQKIRLSVYTVDGVNCTLVRSRTHWIISSCNHIHPLISCLLRFRITVLVGFKFENILAIGIPWLAYPRSRSTQTSHPKILNSTSSPTFYAPSWSLDTWQNRSTDIVIASDIAYVLDPVLNSVELEFSEAREQVICPELGKKERCVWKRWYYLVHTGPDREISRTIQGGAHHRPWRYLRVEYEARHRKSIVQHRDNARMIKTAFRIDGGLQLFPSREHFRRESTDHADTPNGKPNRGSLSA